MSQRTIEMFYHPARKEVRFYNDDHTPMKCSKMSDIQNRSFVLQEQGKDFFDIIANDALDGIKDINIRFFGTQEDYEDFLSMVDYYKSQPDTKSNFSCEQGGVLPGMNEMYCAVEEYGKNAVQILRERADEFRESANSAQSDDSYKSQLESISKSIYDRIAKIEKKINSLHSTGINICFVGTYSSGKSSLINAIIGARILPEANESKTAKFFTIQSPKNNEKPSISFEIEGDITTIEWNGEILCLDKNSGTHEFRKKIQQCIDCHKNKRIHVQFYNVLDLLNTDEEECVGIRIEVRYPLPIDSDALQFTIYDTPGTGSNTIEHTEILRQALAEQSHSIVVFVAGVAKLEGEGNSLLLEMLCGKSQNRIDMDRSLFVINRCDTSTTRKGLQDYKTGKITMIDYRSEEKKCIDLQDKKLFFVCASQATAAKACLCKWATEDDEDVWSSIKKFNFYQFNQYGKSELATKRMIDAANAARECADNDFEKAYIDVGLFSLIGAIREYGEKYAIGTKLNALINAVLEQLTEIRIEANNQHKICDTKLSDLEKDLGEITNKLLGAIDEGFFARIPQKGDDGRYIIKYEKKAQLHLDTITITTVQEEICNEVSNALKGRRRRLKRTMNVEKVNKQEIADIIKACFNEYLSVFNSAQRNVIGKEKNEYIQFIIEAIDNSDLTEAGKSKLKEGLKSVAHISEVELHIDIENIINHKKKTSGFWIFKKEIITTSDLICEIEKRLVDELDICTQEYLKNYAQNLYNALSETKNCFEKNKDEYFVIIQTLKSSMDLVQSVADRLTAVANSLQQLTDDLKKMIWEPRTSKE